MKWLVLSVAALLIALAPLLRMPRFESLLLLAAATTNLVALYDSCQVTRFQSIRTGILLRVQAVVLAAILGYDLKDLPEMARLCFALLVFIVVMFWLTGRPKTAVEEKSSPSSTASTTPPTGRPTTTVEEKSSPSSTASTTPPTGRPTTTVEERSSPSSTASTTPLLFALSLIISVGLLPTILRHVGPAVETLLRARLASSLAEHLTIRFAAYTHLLVIPLLYLVVDLLVDHADVPAAENSLTLDYGLVATGLACASAGFAAQSPQFEAGASAVMLLLGNYAYLIYVGPNAAP
jgi:hypothetical protein